jgi:hypothetical protein
MPWEFHAIAGLQGSNPRKPLDRTALSDERLALVPPF